MGCGGSCGTGGGCGGGGCGSGGSSNGCPAVKSFDWLEDLQAHMPLTSFEVVEVAFKGRRTAFYRNTLELDILTGDHVIVEADRGRDLGEVHLRGELVRLRVRAEGYDEDEHFPNILRLASLDDLERRESIREKEAETFHVGREAIERHGLPMKLVDVEWQFDEKKVTFYFTADHRVDFRQLVRDLASIFRTRIELRHIGARDEAARIGGIGSCGRELCCSTWIRQFVPVSKHSARIQNLPLSPARLNGQCGRLKCCLNYELEQYMSALEQFPPLDTLVQTSRGTGSVQKIDIFKDRVWLQYRDGSWQDLPLGEVRALLGPNGE